MAARLAHLAATATLAKDAWFELKTPDGRTVRVKHSTAENLQLDLLPGYVLKARVFGADETGKGGIAAPIGIGPSFMTNLLAAHGDELREWLMAQEGAPGARVN